MTKVTSNDFQREFGRYRAIAQRELELAELPPEEAAAFDHEYQR